MPAAAVRAKWCLAKGYFRDWARVVEVDLRGRPRIAVTRVYPSESDSRDGTRGRGFG